MSAAGTEVSASVIASSPGLGGSFSNASASYGYVSAYARASSGISGSTFFHGFWISNTSADATASFDDFMTIYGGSGEGTVEAIGSFVCCHYYDAMGSARFTLGGAAVSAPQNENGSTFDLLTPFTFGVPFEIRGNASVFASDFAPSDPSQGSSDGLATVSLSTLIVRDGNGQLLTGYTYSTASESRYTLQDGTFAPEPATGTTLLLILIPAFAAYRRHPAFPTKIVCLGPAFPRARAASTVTAKPAPAINFANPGSAAADQYAAQPPRRSAERVRTRPAYS
jgi:hypothetical protein